VIDIWYVKNNHDLSDEIYGIDKAIEEALKLI
jgi:hypothetical protein